MLAVRVCAGGRGEATWHADEAPRRSRTTVIGTPRHARRNAMHAWLCVCVCARARVSLCVFCVTPRRSVCVCGGASHRECISFRICGVCVCLCFLCVYVFVFPPLSGPTTGPAAKCREWEAWVAAVRDRNLAGRARRSARGAESKRDAPSRRMEPTSSARGARRPRSSSFGAHYRPCYQPPRVGSVFAAGRADALLWRQHAASAATRCFDRNALLGQRYI